MIIADKKADIPWSIGLSMFKDYNSETDTMVDKCFEFDWARLKMPKFRTSNEAEVKERCRAMYPFLR